MPKLAYALGGVASPSGFAGAALPSAFSGETSPSGFVESSFCAAVAASSLAGFGPSGVGEEGFEGLIRVPSVEVRGGWAAGFSSVHPGRASRAKAEIQIFRNMMASSEHEGRIGR